MLVLEEVSLSSFQRKSKGIFESLQHMIACTTYFLTDVIKRFNRSHETKKTLSKTMSNYLNLVGRKLLGLDDSNTEASAGDGKFIWHLKHILLNLDPVKGKHFRISLKRI